MLHEGLGFSFPYESSGGEMTYLTLSIIKYLMGVTTEELHLAKEGSFQKYFCMSLPLASH